MTPDYTKAAVKAAETLVRSGVKTAPISALPILSQMENVIVISFADLGDFAGINQRDFTPLFCKNQDAVTSIHTENGKQIYLVAYNSLLPFAMIQRALAREMGHIVLKHTGCAPENTEEALCFAHHLLCPRAIIHAIQAFNLRVTSDLLANLTGVFDQDLVSIRRIPGTNVPSGLNRFIRSQFMPFIMNFFNYYQTILPKDGSALADLGTYMDGYVE